jgi:hypothetical protein
VPGGAGRCAVRAGRCGAVRGRAGPGAGGASLEPEHRRGHGAAYDAVSAGRVDIARLRWSLAALPWPDGRIRLAVDVSNWLRPDAACSPERLFCHVYGRGKSQAQMIPGWPYSFIAALEPGRTSWTAVLDAVRLGPDDDETEVTAVQVRQVIARLIAAGHWRGGDPDMLIVFDADYDVARLAWQLAGLPVEVAERLTHRGARLDHDGTLPVIEGTLIRLAVGHLPGDRNPQPVWPWFSRTGATPEDVDRCWQAFLRRFDLEHTFRLFKQVLGLTAPKLRRPAAADRWTWLIIAAHAQLRLARPLASDLRLPRQRPATPGRLTPARSAADSGTSARQQVARPGSCRPGGRG